MFGRAAQALADGRRLVALNRMGAARSNVAAYEFVARQPALALTDTTGFAAAWVREGAALRALPPAVPARARTLRPAAIRALAEAAIPQVRNYYDAGLEYGYSTQPEFGYFYIGVARAQREFFDLCVSLSEPTALPGNDRGVERATWPSAQGDQTIGLAFQPSELEMRLLV